MSHIPEFTRLGCYFSFSGKGFKIGHSGESGHGLSKPQQLVSKVPLDKLLIESDGDGGRAQVTRRLVDVSSTCSKIAQHLRIPLHELAAITHKNSEIVFKSHFCR